MSDPFVLRVGHHADRYVDTRSEAETAALTEEFAAITGVFVSLMAEGAPVEDERVQDAVRAHYAFCCRFWRPTRRAYKSLALSYVLPTPYRDAYEGVAAGLGSYIHKAIESWADRSLTD